MSRKLFKKFGKILHQNAEKCPKISGMFRIRGHVLLPTFIDNGKMTSSNFLVGWLVLKAAVGIRVSNVHPNIFLPDDFVV